MHRMTCRLLLMALLMVPRFVLAAGKAEHVVVVVWDGLRPDFISQEHTPTLHQLARDGVLFQNHHAAYLSATEVNGTVLATGHYPEHTGIIANRIYRTDVDRLKAVDTQNLDVIRKADHATGGCYLPHSTVAETLQAAGRRTVVAGTKQVAVLQDRRERPDQDPAGITLFAGNTLPPSTLPRIKSQLGSFPPEVDKTSSLPNEPRDEWTTRALLGPLWTNGVPAFTLLWLIEPDSSQHAAGLGSPRAIAALESSDRKLAAVIAELDRCGLRGKTDVFVVSDHGFSTVEKSVDVCQVLRDAGLPARRSFLLRPGKGDILVVGQGGSVLFYVIGRGSETTRRLVRFLQQQDFTGVLFTREPVPGAFALKQGQLQSPEAPDVVMSLRWSSRTNAFGIPGLLCGDGTTKPGYGMHASLGPADMHNTLVAVGPDLKSGFTSTLPSGNIDLAPTILWLLGVQPQRPLDGRILSEALAVDAPPAGQPTTQQLEAVLATDHLTWRQYLQISQVNQTRLPGRRQRRRNDEIGLGHYLIEKRHVSRHIQSMKSVFTGPVYVVRDNIDTDQIIPAQYLNLVPTIADEYEKLGSYALCGLPESLYPTRFVKEGQLDSDYPIVVAGRNFGCGSSREHAPIALGSAGCKVVLAESFARIFFRNSVATGELYPCEITERLCDVLKTGDAVKVDLDAGTVTLQSTGQVCQFKPLGDVRPVVDAGGLFNYARKTGMISK